MQLWRLSATELAAAYRARTTTPDTVLEATLERIDAVNPQINAIVTPDAAGARAAAQASRKRWHAGVQLGPLDGVPITIKDSIFVRGLRATWGSRLYQEFVPTEDDTPVARLRAAGAVILGKTNVPEFTVHGFTDNLLFGPTRNPWNTELTPGGSSGGAVAATAAGLGALALGTDGGGSIRRPAAHTGLVGLKPSRGMVPRGPGFPAILHDFEVVGPIARCVDDNAIAMDAIGGPAWMQPCPPFRTPSRIMVVERFGDAPVDPQIAQAVSAAAADLETIGHRVEIVGSSDFAEPIAAVWPVISQTGIAWLLARDPGRDQDVSPALAEMARAGAAYRAIDYLTALETIAQVEREVADLFTRIDVLLTPATAAMPWPAREMHPSEIAGRAVGPRGHAVFTPFANALGLPAISLPCRVWPESLPVGFQLCAWRGRDAALLALARDYERLLPARWPPL